jgi:hypothetical protein
MKAFAAIILALSVLATPADVATSADYELTTVAIDAGGGRSASANYTSDLSFGLTSGRNVATFFYGNALGYPAQMNNPPMAGDDLRSHPYDTPLDIFILSLLSNDADLDFDPLQIKQFNVTTEAGGSVALAGPYLRYTPAPAFRGTDHFTYTVIDANGDIDTATVALIAIPPMVTPANALTVSRLPDGNLLVRFQGPTNGNDYIVQTKGDLSESEWKILFVAHVGGDGVVEFVINPRIESHRFFQAVVF